YYPPPPPPRERNNSFNKIYEDLNGNDGYFEFPLCIDIELTNNCNLHCLFCPTGTGASIRNKGFMSEETFMRIINSLKGYHVGLRFSRWGEPTLHRNIVKYFKIAKENGHLLHLNTNGQLLNETLIKNLVELGLDSIKFSFQGVDERTYQEMRQDSSFNTLINNIKMTHQLRGNRLLPYIHIATTTTYETDSDIDIFKKTVRPYCDYVTVGKTKLEHIDVNKVTKLNENQKDILTKLKTKESMVEDRLKICPEVFGKISIDWDGKISACCSDYNREMIIGDIQKNTIAEIFHNDIVEKYRNILRKQEFEKIPHCNRCFDLMSLQGKNKISDNTY
ncbi:MAG: radical SAM protein, partial [Treponema sp.]|nr:radical SAM protein [Treponema sp.]